MTPDAPAPALAPSHPPATTGAVAWRHWTALAAIVLLAGALRVHHLSRAALGIDELFSVHFATAHGPWESSLPAPGQWVSSPPRLQSVAYAGPWWRIPHALLRDTHPPLHPMALRAWMEVFGDSDSAARALSVVLSLAAILLLFDAVRWLHSPSAGLWAAGIMAVAGPQIEYAQEIRGYMMLTCLACAAAAGSARLVVRGVTWRRALAFAAVCLLGMLTHYWAIAPLSAAAAFLAMELSPAGRRRVAACVAVTALVYLLAWGPWVWAQRPYFSANLQTLAEPEPDGHALRTLRMASMVPLRLLYDPGPRVLAAAEAGRDWRWAAVGVTFLLPLPLLRAHRGMRLWWLMLVLPVAIVAAADLLEQRRTINLPRYVLPAGVGLYGLIAATGAASATAWRRHALPACAALACVAALPMAWDRTKPDWRTLAREAMMPDDARGRPVILLGTPGSRWRIAIVYMAVCRYAGPPAGPITLVETPEQAAAAVATLPPEQRGSVVVLHDALEPPVAQYFPGATLLRSSGVPWTGSWAVIRPTAPLPD